MEVAVRFRRRIAQEECKRDGEDDAAGSLRDWESRAERYWSHRGEVFRDSQYLEGTTLVFG